MTFMDLVFVWSSYDRIDFIHQHLDFYVSDALATQPGDDFVWLKDGVMLKTSGACFTASDRKWPAEIKCTNYNFHTSDGIYFCVNEVTNQLFNLKIIHLQGQLNSNPGLCE